MSDTTKMGRHGQRSSGRLSMAATRRSIVEYWSVSGPPAS
jgi:hypothetical protein